MVGIVIVSHSAKLAAGARELAAEMGGDDVPIEVAGGLDEPDHPMGTDAALVLQAIEKVRSDAGVLVLMDLGSAVMSAEMALDMLDGEQSGHVMLCAAPLVEGAVAAAAASKGGASLEEVASEARGGLAGKEAHLGGEEDQAGKEQAPTDEPAREFAAEEKARLAVGNRLGLHARPAARFVRTAGRFDAQVRVTNLATGAGPVTAKSLNALATLGVRQGQDILVEASGPQAGEVIEALRDLAGDDFGDREEREEEEGDAPTPAFPRPEVPGGAAFSGLAASPGVAGGPVRRLAAPAPEVPEEDAGEPEDELRSLSEALGATRADLEATRDSLAGRVGGDEASILDAHLLLLEDETLIEPARAAIENEGQSAPRAWNDSVEASAARYEDLEDGYMRERAADVRDVGRAVLAHLVGTPPGKQMSAAGVVVAAELSPAETAALDPELVGGIVTARGGPTGHAAILARSLALPAVVGAGDGVLEIEEGTTIWLDGESGAVYVEPGGDVRRELESRAAEREARLEAAQAAARDPAVTSDGRTVEVMANIASSKEVAAALRAGADGVGLLRTELLFSGRSGPPRQEEQQDAYRAVAEALAGRPLTLRTLDAGGDKPLGYLDQEREDNPFLGERGIRLSLAHPDAFGTQLRAALVVAADHPLRIMFPMVTTLDELRRARAILDHARDELAGDGVELRDECEVGIMVEVPAAALAARTFAPVVDFFSIGTNDLAQYTTAADRGSRRVAHLADPLDPSVLRLMSMVTEAAAEHGKWVGLCGELGGDPAATPLLVGLGITELSMGPASIPLVKDAVRRCSAGEAGELASSALAAASPDEVRALLGDAGSMPDTDGNPPQQATEG
ncbi:phosphoenolpyruvate--protein phosphotransferase [soil metagenome]